MTVFIVTLNSTKKNVTSNTLNCWLSGNSHTLIVRINVSTKLTPTFYLMIRIFLEFSNFITKVDLSGIILTATNTSKSPCVFFANNSLIFSRFSGDPFNILIFLIFYFYKFSTFLVKVQTFLFVSS